MRHGKKFFVYLQRSSVINGTEHSVRNSQSDGHFFYPKRCDENMAVCKPCALVVMATAVPFEDLSGRTWHTAFFVPKRSKFKQMATSKMKQSFVSMTKWSLRKMFEKFPDEQISLKELIDLLTISWDEMVNDGEIEIQEGR